MLAFGAGSWRLCALLDDAEEVSTTLPCLQDSFARMMLSAFPSYSKLRSEQAQMMLSGLARNTSIDILEVEARHAATRRLNPKP